MRRKMVFFQAHKKTFKHRCSRNLKEPKLMKQLGSVLETIKKPTLIYCLLGEENYLYLFIFSIRYVILGYSIIFV